MFARLIIVVGVLLSSPSAATAAPVDDITITTRAIEELDNNRFFTRVGGTLLGTTEYTGLTPGQSYTVSSQLVDRDTGAVVGEAVFQTFVPEAPAGTQTVELPIEPNRTASNIYLALVQVLYDGEVTAGTAASAVALAEQTDIDNVDQTVEVHAVQAISVTAVDAADGDNSLPATGGTVVATVNHVNLVAGYKYTVGGQMLTPSGQATGVYANVPLYEPVDKDGTLTLEFAVPARFDGLRLVPSVGLYHQNRVVINANGGIDWLVDAPQPVMIASDPALADPAKTIEVGTPFDAAASTEATAPATDADGSTDPSVPDGTDTGATDTARTDTEASGTEVTGSAAPAAVTTAADMQDATASSEDSGDSTSTKWVWLGAGVLFGALAALGAVRLMSPR